MATQPSKVIAARRRERDTRIIAEDEDEDEAERTPSPSFRRSTVHGKVVPADTENMAKPRLVLEEAESRPLSCASSSTADAAATGPRPFSAHGSRPVSAHVAVALSPRDANTPRQRESFVAALRGRISDHRNRNLAADARDASRNHPARSPRVARDAAPCSYRVPAQQVRQS